MRQVFWDRNDSETGREGREQVDELVGGDGVGWQVWWTEMGRNI